MIAILPTTHSHGSDAIISQFFEYLVFHDIGTPIELSLLW